MHEFVQALPPGGALPEASSGWTDAWYVKPTEKDGRGWGATEAIRGALCHWIEVQGGKIKNYQIVAPTTWNVGPRARDGERGPIEQSLIGTPIADPADPVEVGHVCRSYDSCLVCTVHAHDARTGRGACPLPHGVAGLRPRAARVKHAGRLPGRTR